MHRAPQASRTELALHRQLEEVARDHHPVHLGRPVVDPRRARVLVDPRDREIHRDPGRAVHLHRAVGDPPERLGHERLGHRDLLAVRQPVLHLPRRVQHHQPRCVEVHRGVGEHELQPLVARELLAERLARQQPLGGEVERALGDADPAHRVREPPAREPLLRDHEALAVAAEQVRRRHPHFGELDLGVPAGRVRAHPLGMAHEPPAGRVRRDEDERVVAMAGGVVGPGLGDHDREGRAVGARDAPLAPIEHPLVALEHGRRLEVRRVRGGHVRLRHREAGARAPLGERAQVGLELLGVPAISSVCMFPSSGAIALRPSEARPETPNSCEISAIPSVPTPSAAPLLGQVRRVDAALARAVAEPIDDVPARQQVGRVLDLRLGRQRLLRDERRTRPSRSLELGREREVQHRPDAIEGARFEPEVLVGLDLDEVHLGLLQLARVVPVHRLPAGELVEHPDARLARAVAGLPVAAERQVRLGAGRRVVDRDHARADALAEAERVRSGTVV